MPADDHAVEDVVFKLGGVLQALPAGSVPISMSTISVAPLGLKDNRLLLSAAEEAGAAIARTSYQKRGTPGEAGRLPGVSKCTNRR